MALRGSENEEVVEDGSLILSCFAYASPLCGDDKKIA
jgi:hypothetical protein